MTSRPFFRAALAGALLFIGLSSAQAASPTDLKPEDFHEFGKLAIQDGGRRKPVETYATESLLRITGRASFRSEAGHTWTANEWLLSMLIGSHEWQNEPFVLVSHRPLLEKLGLDPAKKRFAPAELAKNPGLEPLAKAVHQKRVADDKAPLDRMEQEVESVMSRLGLFNAIVSGNSFLLVPAKSSAKEPWVIPPDFARYWTKEQFDKPLSHLQAMARAFSEGDGFKLTAESRNLRLSLRELSPAIYPAESKLSVETTYNHLRAFERAAWLYLIGLIGVGVWAARPGSPRAFRWIGLTAALGGFALHAAGIALRCVIAGRPPVTNMFESVIWVSFVAMTCGFIFFLRYRTPVYLVAALPAAALCLALVLQLPSAMPENIDPLVPVLRDNFWLTIHVLSIAASYGAFLLAWAFGHILLWQYAVRPEAARRNDAMHFWNYRIIQLGVLLLAAGTILGGVWANYSWGRFWGWDPKETAAFIALLCYIVALHGRIAGYWGHFGLAVASCVCFLSILFAWYGVNFILGAGLHSYGFGIGGEAYVAAFVIADILFISVAVMRHLRSTKQARAERTAARGLPAREASEEAPATAAVGR